MDQRARSRQAILITGLASSVLVLLSGFLPWATVLGIDVLGGGATPIVVGVLSPAILLIWDRGNTSVLPGIAICLLGLLLLLLAVTQFVAINEPERSVLGRGAPFYMIAPGTGLYAADVGGIGLVGSGLAVFVASTPARTRSGRCRVCGVIGALDAIGCRSCGATR